MGSFVKEQWFILGMILSIGFALWFPRLSEYLKPYLTPMVFVSILLTALTISNVNFKEQLFNYKGILFNLGAVFILSPALFYGLGNLFYGSDPILLTGLIVLGSIPPTLVSHIVLTTRSRGNHSLSVINTIMSNLFTIFFTPLILSLLLPMETPNLMIPILEKLFFYIIIPVSISQIFIYFSRFPVDKYKDRLSIITQFLILVFIFYGIGSQYDYLSEEPLTILPLCLLLISIHLLIVLSVYLITRLLKYPLVDRIALMFSSSQKSLPVGLLIAASALDYTSALYPIVFYHILQLIFDGFISSYFAKQSTSNQQGETREKEND